MTDIDWTHATEIPRDRLPAAITGYLRARKARDLAAAVGYLAEDATVTDEGRIFEGRRAISDWLATSASEYTYTSELSTARRVDARHYDALHHLEGNFPGGVIDLHFRFDLDGDKITRLVIEP